MRVKALSICLIGYGYWGKNLLRILMEYSHSTQVCVAEISEAKRNQLKYLYPSLAVYSSFEEVLEKEQINAAVVATETGTHYTLVKKALLAGKHVLVEKPITTSVSEATELVNLAHKNNLTLMVDHIFLYNPVVRKMKEYFTSDFLGKVNYIDATRINLGIYQKDTNVLWDLACHDISIVNYLFVEKPISVRAIGRINPEYRVEDIAYMFLYYSSGTLVQINSSWASPVKIRKMIVGGEKRMIIYDDIEPSNKLVIYEYAQDIALDENKNELGDYRLGNIIIPKYEIQEPLKNVITEFCNSILHKQKPLADGQNALEVVRVLEKAQESLNSNGSIIPLI